MPLATPLTYSNNVVLGSRYNARGYLTDLINANSGYVYQYLNSVDAQGQFTQYIDGLYEIDLEANQQRSFIGDNTLLNWHPDDGYQLLFTLKDSLDSATTLTNHDGQVISRRYFDPFGKTSSAFDNTTTDIKVGLNTDANANSTHANNAFTDLNKNNLGRFLSVDPFIQSPGNTQSVNPYACIMNNPLVGTDPTGYCSAPTGSTVKRCATVDVYKAPPSVLIINKKSKVLLAFSQVLS